MGVSNSKIIGSALKNPKKVKFLLERIKKCSQDELLLILYDNRIIKIFRGCESEEIIDSIFTIFSRMKSIILKSYFVLEIKPFSRKIEEIPLVSFYTERHSLRKLSDISKLKKRIYTSQKIYQVCSSLIEFIYEKINTFYLCESKIQSILKFKENFYYDESQRLSRSLEYILEMENAIIKYNRAIK